MALAVSEPKTSRTSILHKLFEWIVGTENVTRIQNPSHSLNFCATPDLGIHGATHFTEPSLIGSRDLWRLGVGCEIAYGHRQCGNVICWYAIHQIHQTWWIPKIHHDALLLYIKVAVLFCHPNHRNTTWIWTAGLWRRVASSCLITSQF